MNPKRPINLDLSTIKFPPMAIASILHRISGIVLFLLLPLMLYFLDISLRSAASFEHAQTLFASPYCKLFLWAFASAIAYHLFAGIRHLIMDMGFAEHVSSGRRGAIIVITLAVISIIFLGIWIW